MRKTKDFLPDAMHVRRQWSNICIILKNLDNTFQEPRQNKDFFRHKKDERAHHKHTCTTWHKGRPFRQNKMLFGVNLIYMKKWRAPETITSWVKNKIFSSIIQSSLKDNGYLNKIKTMYYQVYNICKCMPVLDQRLEQKKRKHIIIGFLYYWWNGIPFKGRVLWAEDVHYRP